MTYGDVIRNLSDEDLVRFIIVETKTAVKSTLQGTGFFFDEEEFDKRNPSDELLELMKKEVDI